MGNSDGSKRFKMYKSSKGWIVAGLAILTFGVAGLATVSNTQDVNADASGATGLMANDSTTADSSGTTAIVGADSTVGNTAVTTDGIQHSVSFQATNSTTGKVETGALSQATPSTSVLDNSNAKSVTEKWTLTNTTSADITNINAWISVNAGLDTTSISPNLPSGGVTPVYSPDSGSSSLSIGYSFSTNPGTYSSIEALTATYGSAIPWGQLSVIQVQGSLKANQSVTLSVPVTVNDSNKDVANGDSVAAEDTVYGTSVGTVTGSTTANLKITETTDSQPTASGKYIGVTKNGATKATTIPSQEELKLPDISAADIVFQNFGVTGGDVLYQGGTYTVKTAAIQAAINGDGYSVPVSPSTGKPYDSLTYSSILDKVTIVDADGNPVSAGDLVPGQTTVKYGNVYVPLVQVIDAKDSSIAVGSTWTAADNFVSESNPAQFYPTTTTDFDKATNLTVTGSVDTSKAGRYPVTYAYTSADGTVISSKKVTVTVGNPVTATLTAKDQTIANGAKVPDAASFVNTLTDEDGNAITPAAGTITATVDGKALSTIDTSKSGSYTVKVTYTDADGNTASDTATLTVKAATSTGGGNGGTTTPSNPVTDDSSSSDVGTNDGAGATAPTSTVKGLKIYSKKAIYLYKNATFNKSQRLASYAKKTRVEAPVFTVTSEAKSKNGALRYKVTTEAGKTGYVTANSAYTAPLYWAGNYKTLYVINPAGTYEYKSTKFSKSNRVKLLKQSTVVKVKKVVKSGLTTRYLLTNGNYISGNKEWTSPTKPTKPAKVQNKGALNLYSYVNLKHEIKHYKASSKHVFTVKKWDYSNGRAQHKGNTLRYKVAGGYISGNTKLVKSVK